MISASLTRTKSLIRFPDSSNNEKSIKEEAKKKSQSEIAQITSSNNIGNLTTQHSDCAPDQPKPPKQESAEVKTKACSPLKSAPQLVKVTTTECPSRVATFRYSDATNPDENTSDPGTLSKINVSESNESAQNDIGPEDGMALSTSVSEQASKIIPTDSENYTTVHEGHQPEENSERIKSNIKLDPELVAQSRFKVIPIEGEDDLDPQLRPIYKETNVRNLASSCTIDSIGNVKPNENPVNEDACNEAVILTEQVSNRNLIREDTCGAANDRFGQLSIPTEYTRGQSIPVMIKETSDDDESVVCKILQLFKYKYFS